MRNRRRRRLGLGAALAAFVIALVAGAAVLEPSTPAAASCPVGYKLLAKEEAAMEQAGVQERESLVHEVAAGSTCVNTKHPESLIELEIRGRQFDAVRAAPHGKTHPGAFAGALEQRAAMPRSVDGSAGTWRPVGHGPLISNGPAYNSVNGLGLVNLMGRIDSLTYDPATKRLFASKGTGGVWMSTDNGQTWRSIGDGLPSQIVGAVPGPPRTRAPWSLSAATRPSAPGATPVTERSTATTWARPGPRPRASLTERSASRSKSTRRIRRRSTPQPSSVSTAPPTGARATPT